MCKRILLGMLILIFYIVVSSVYAQTKFGFPKTTCKIMVLTDQLPYNMSEEQVVFAAKHYVGSQKLTLDISKRIRFYSRLFKRPFVVLHYHLGIWQQNPNHNFIIDGRHWGNDWNFVTKHEDWFWHNKKGKRVYSRIDGKYLMNISNKDFVNYWKTSILKQIEAGKYNGVFLDSSSIALLQYEASHLDPRLAKTNAKTKKFKELNNKTWKEAYEEFMKDLTNFLEQYGYPTIPNITALFTTWDNTDYYTTASGAFIEDAFNTKSIVDWKMAMERILRLITKDKIVIFQSYLKDDNDVRNRMYYLGCYLLVKGNYSYLMYFSKRPLSWYPEFDIHLGCPKNIIISSLKELEVSKGVYKREYENGEVWVNVSHKPYLINFKKKVKQVIPIGGGPVDRYGIIHGKLTFEEKTHSIIEPWMGVVVLYN